MGFDTFEARLWAYLYSEQDSLAGAFHRCWALDLTGPSMNCRAGNLGCALPRWGLLRPPPGPMRK